MITPEQIKAIVEEATTKWAFRSPAEVIEEAIREALRIERTK